jgi:hypothetical protein
MQDFDNSVYILLDTFFFVFHSFVIVFILLGWIWKKTRVINLILVLITAFSWTILGIWYGFGYCFFTDWHYQVRMKLGYHDMPSSYIKFLIDSLTGMDVDSRLVDISTFISFLLVFIISVYINARTHFKKG